MITQLHNDLRIAQAQRNLIDNGKTTLDSQLLYKDHNRIGRDSQGRERQASSTARHANTDALGLPDPIRNSEPLPNCTATKPHCRTHEASKRGLRQFLPGMAVDCEGSTLRGYCQLTLRGCCQLCCLPICRVANETTHADDRALPHCGELVCCSSVLMNVQAGILSLLGHPEQTNSL